MTSRIHALHQRLQALMHTASVDWKVHSSKLNDKGEMEAWHLEISGLIMIGLSSRSGKWVVTSGTLPWFPKTTLRATTLAEAKPAAVRVVQAFLRKSSDALDHLNK